MYEIRPETVKTFIVDRNIRLPRFQRKQTWDEKKNFQLCISLFKEYPIGVCILSVDSMRAKTVRWLLDGRQRKNALSLIYEDPENIYNWGKKFIRFKNSDQPAELEEKFWNKINEYIEVDPNEDEDEFEYIQLESNEESEDEQTQEYEFDDEKIDSTKTGLNLLLNIIKIIHNKSKKNTGFTKPFDLSKYIRKLPYMESQNGNSKLSSKRLKTFLDEYRRYCDDEYCDYEKKESFISFINYRCDVNEPNKIKGYIKQNWDAMYERLLIIEKIDSLLSNSKIGMIEVKNLSPSDSQKIFNIINSEGEKLTAVEILSAKPKWNINIENPSQIIVESVGNLYKRIGTSNSNVVRWDLAATLVRRLGRNIVLKDFTDSKSDFEKEITLGFKILAGLYEEGVKKEDIETLSKNNTIIWNTDIENVIYEVKQIFKLIESFDYFKYLRSWRISIMELTSDAIALNFIIILYKDWLRKGKPIGNDIKTKQFQKNSFILFDKLIFEYINKQWRGSSDSKIANNIEGLKSEPDIFIPVAKYKWENMLNEIYESNSIDGSEISLKLMKPILYHFYCINSIQGPDSNYGIEIDHIIPQVLFSQSTIEKQDIVKDNILNLGLLPKDENISKGKKRLIEIKQDWLKGQIEKYEFIKEEEYHFYSDISNYKEIYITRKEHFDNTFSIKRDKILNN